MAVDQTQFYQLLNTLLSTDNDIRSQAEVSAMLMYYFIVHFDLHICTTGVNCETLLYGLVSKRGHGGIST